MKDLKSNLTPLEICLASYDNMPLTAFLKTAKLLTKFLPSVTENLVLQVFNQAAKSSANGSTNDLKQKAYLKVLDRLIRRFPYVLTLKYTEMKCSLLHLVC